MTNRKIVWLAVAGLALAPLAHAGLRHAVNANAVYGEGITNSSTLSASTTNASESWSGKDTIGGAGFQVSGLSRALWFIHIGFNYGFGPLAKGGTATGVVNGTASGPVTGHSRALNLRFGKGFRIGAHVLLGPYVAYQYAQFTAELGSDSLTYANNGVGGGFFAVATATRALAFLGHVDYLVSASASASLSGTPVQNMPGAGVLQVGVKMDYHMTEAYSLFFGTEYDRYSASYTAPSGVGSASGRIQELRGLIGIAYHY